MVAYCRCAVDKTENTFGMTALDMAILMGDVESTAQLLAAGADPEHLLKLFALTELYDVTVIHPDKKKTRDLLVDDDKVSALHQLYPKQKNSVSCFVIMRDF